MKIDSYVSDRHRKRKKRRAYFLGAAALIAAYLVLLGIAWLVLRSPVFRAAHIVVTGESAVSSDQVVTLLESAALRDHNFIRSVLGFPSMFAWPSVVPAKDLMFIPQLASVTVSKNYLFRTITVDVTERAPAGVWCFTTGKECYWFDGQGVIFERATDTEGALFFTVEDESQPPAGLNLKILPDRFVPNLVSILGVLHGSGLNVTGITLADLSREEISVRTAKGPSFYFSLRFPADDYLPVIKSLMAQVGFAKIGYVDCRTENRVYYK